MSNPYQPPGFDPKQFQDQQYFPQPVAATGLGMVSQIRVVAILNCVQGGLEVLVGLMLVVMAFVIPSLIAAQQAGQPGGPPAGFEWVMIGTYGVMGGGLLIAGSLRLYAGIQNFRFRARTLGIVSLSVGLLSMLGCYCAPTSIAVFIYGLIVYLNPAVKAAFDMGQQGMNADQILASFVAPATTPFKPQS
jgi:hypothetical protein